MAVHFCNPSWIVSDCLDGANIPCSKKKRPQTFTQVQMVSNCHHPSLSWRVVTIRPDWDNLTTFSTHSFKPAITCDLANSQGLLQSILSVTIRQHVNNVVNWQTARGCHRSSPVLWPVADRSMQHNQALFLHLFSSTCKLFCVAR